LVGALALVIVGIGTAVASRRVGEREAITEARTATLAKVQGSVEPLVTDPRVNSDPTAMAALGTTVHRDVLDDRLVRVKLWRDDRTIIYSDEPRLISHRFDLR